MLLEEISWFTFIHFLAPTPIITSILQVKLKVHDVDDHRLALELNSRNLLPSIVLHEVQECSLAGR